MMEYWNFITSHLSGDWLFFRLFELPGNGVMQISDGGEYLGEFFEVSEKIESYETAEELNDKVKYYLAHDNARERIARAGYRRVIRDHRIGSRLETAPHLVESASIPLRTRCS